MKKMLFPVDSEHGHVVEDGPDGPIYRDDRTLVDDANPRPCFGCKLHVKVGEPDPCTGILPGTYQACCGHGLDKSPRTGRPNGYVALNDGRVINFSGCVGADAIRTAVDAALANKDLPDGFLFDTERMWWEGLTPAQVEYVRGNIVRELIVLVREARGGKSPSEAFLAGQAMWWDELVETEKDYVHANMRAMLAKLVLEAIELVPADAAPDTDGTETASVETNPAPKPEDEAT